MYGVTHAGAVKTARRMNGEAEPLLRFAEAKKVLGEIYTDLGKHVDELDEVYKGIVEPTGGGAGDSGDCMVPNEQAAEIELFRESINTIMETFRRDNMKVVFFGRTSNGKSTTINAMLHAKILPQGMGHTTCCFLQVQGCNEDTGYLLLEDNPTRIPIDQLSKIGHALSSDNSGLPAMGQDSLLRVFYPKGRGETENRLLQNDVVILDSPGVDLSPEFDSWIDKHCLDADVFVLVLNAESTLTQAEKSFFHRVAKKLSKPNVFILNNRWDASAAESEHVEDVKQQHLTRFRQFLVNELEVATDRDVKDRIFFVSSREMLDARLKARGLIKTPYQMDGHQVRAMEFEMFERQFEQCISRAAIRTKFEAHNRRANEIIARMRANVDVSADFSEEIMRLEAIVDRFNMPFLDTTQGIIEYKRALAEFTDKCVSSDLEARCTGGLMSRIWNLENDMFQYVTKILAEPYQHKLEEVWRYRAPFKFSICVDAPALTKDFHEDLEFRFTFGLSAIIRRIIAYRSGQPVTAIQANLLTPMALRNAGRSNEDLHNEAMQKAVEENAMMTQMVLTSASYLANGSIGLLVVGGIVYRAVGWRVIAVTAAAYGGLYVWERMRWNSHAKEQHLKEQFRSHLAARMQQVGAAHTTHCETQAMREMDQVFDGLRATVAGVHREMKDELDMSKKEIEKVDGTLKSLVTIKNEQLNMVLKNGTDVDMDEGIADINIDDGLKYDIDLIKEELEYYKKEQEKRREDGDVSDNDSAIDSARVWDLPVPVRTQNGPRKKTDVCTVVQRAITLKNLHKVELLRAEQYILTKDRLVFHLLAFIDLPKNQPPAYEDPPLYSVCNDAIVVDSNYQFKESDPQAQYGEEHLVNIAIPYLATHLELRELTNFVDKLESTKGFPAFWQSYKFDWLNVELAWNNIFVVMDQGAELNEDETTLVIQLQEGYCQLLLRIMDHIYSFGNVPEIHENYFILYNDPTDPELLITRSHPGVESLLWDDSLLLMVLRGARARFRLGPELDVAPVFSSAFHEYLKALGWSEGMFISFQQFRHSFRSAATTLTHELSNKLLLQIRAAGLHEYWQDMKEITCGRVAHCFAAYVYGCTSDPSKIVTLDMTDLYSSALLRSGMSQDRAKKWRLAQTAVSETDHSINCDLERPLSYVFRPSLIPAMNACMDNMFKIFRVVELLTSVSSDRKSADDYRQVNEDRAIAERRVRHMFFIVFKLLSLVSVIKDLFVEKVTSIFDRHAEVLERAEEVEEVDYTLAQAESELQALMARTDIRKQFHEIVDILKRLAEEIRLKSVSNDLTSDTLLRWHKTTVRTVEFLALIGAAMPVDSVFHALHVCRRSQHQSIF
ncbi:fzo-like region [Ancylostoma duodenale]|uniref:Fzo-like region n=1 Tax=Ancylostoma duodenale TaxID=51022 RepID=A0A0C2GTJ7_9BILA|nr:fzo-like region [Ancylostoma duodenale]